MLTPLNIILFIDYYLKTSKIQFNLPKSLASMCAQAAWVHVFVYTCMYVFVFTCCPSESSPTFANCFLLYLDTFHVAQPAGGGKI